MLPKCDRDYEALVRRSMASLRAKRSRSRHRPRTLQSRLHQIHLRLRCLRSDDKDDLVSTKARVKGYRPHTGKFPSNRVEHDIRISGVNHAVSVASLLPFAVSELRIVRVLLQVDTRRLRSGYVRHGLPSDFFFGQFDRFAFKDRLILLYHVAEDTGRHV